jgi:hypothetical protein
MFTTYGDGKKDSPAGVFRLLSIFEARPRDPKSRSACDCLKYKSTSWMRTIIKEAAESQATARLGCTKRSEGMRITGQ